MPIEKNGTFKRSGQKRSKKRYFRRNAFFSEIDFEGESYWIIRKIDKGGEGKVKLLKNKKTAEFKAVKISEYIEAAEKDAKFSADFQRKQSYFVRKRLVADDKAYSVMDYYRGPNLFRLINDMKEEDHNHYALSLRKAFQIILACAEQIKSMHEKFDIHGDIKLENFILQRDHSIKLVDFGLALKEGEVRQTGVGTLTYIAPEVYRCEKLTCKMDIYSFGFLFLEILCERRMEEKRYDSKNREEILQRCFSIIEKRFTNNQFNGLEEIKILMGNMLQELPEKRPSIDDIMTAINKHLEKNLDTKKQNSVQEKNSERLEKSIEKRDITIAGICYIPQLRKEFFELLFNTILMLVAKYHRTFNQDTKHRIQQMLGDKLLFSEKEIMHYSTLRKDQQYKKMWNLFSLEKKSDKAEENLMSKNNNTDQVNNLSAILETFTLKNSQETDVFFIFDQVGKFKQIVETNLKDYPIAKGFAAFLEKILDKLTRLFSTFSPINCYDELSDTGTFSRIKEAIDKEHEELSERLNLPVEQVSKLCK